MGYGREDEGRQIVKWFCIIGGPMGVGKTTVGQILKRQLENCAFLDGDWCWDMHPFRVNERTKALVMDNICCVLGNFLRCGEFDHIVFCWVMYEQRIIDEICSSLDLSDWKILSVSLVCSEEALEERIRKDMGKGLRSGGVLERSLERMKLYDRVQSVKIDTTGKAPEKVAEEIVMQMRRR